MLARHCAALIAVAALACSPATAGISGDAPDIIVCRLAPTSDRPGGNVAYYIAANFDDGVSIYKTLTNTATQLRVDAAGMVRVQNLPDCNGATVQQLRESGRAFDYR